jgi:hypothetical protein
VRKFSTRVVQKRSRSEREVENNLQSRKQESSDTSRAETEIIRKALSRTNFTQTAEGGYNVEVWNASGKTAFEKTAETSSSDAKKEFHEAVLKAAEEYKREHTLEVKTEEAEEKEVTESREISNPNDELAVTFLFYELQRRYLVSESIHKVTPVVLVAQEVPSPDEIDEAWLVAHDWILRRSILDDSFLPGLTYVSTRLAGDEQGRKVLRETVDLQRRVVEELKRETVGHARSSRYRLASLERATEEYIDTIRQEDTEGALESVGEFFTGGGESPESDRLRQEAAKDAYERAVREERDLRARLDREVTALHTATETYTKALIDALNRKEQILRLRVHVMDNILYYMQAIWSHEPPDQRFFRLYQAPIADLKGERTYKLHLAPSGSGRLPHLQLSDHRLDAEIQLDPHFKWTSLVEVADLDRLLGFKGNYMIFPLKRSNTLTDFMMAPYADAALGLRDPDESGDWTLEEFATYVCCLEKHLSEAEFGSLRDQLKEEYLTLLSAQRRQLDEVVVPTGSLFIEALPGAHPLLEDFKLAHRILDVKKVQAEVRKAELENVRAAARLLAGEREDPDVEKKILIEGRREFVGPDVNE